MKNDIFSSSNTFCMTVEDWLNDVEELLVYVM